MALEIRELVIKATVNTQMGAKPSAGISAGDLRALKKEILQACKEQTKELLEDRLSR